MAEDRIATAWQGLAATMGDVDIDSDPDTADPTEHTETAGLHLSPIEARLLGVLIEKALATPQNYPLSVNALATGSNQTTNRDPLTHYTEGEIADELAPMKERRLLRFVHPTSGRGVTKYRHVLDEHLDIDEGDAALLSVLLVRGPQTVAELRARTERLHRYDDTAAIEARLAAMTSGAGQRLTQRLERDPGAREPRWVQLLCPEQGLERSGGAAASATPDPTTSSATSPVATPPAGHDREIAALRAELTALRAEFEAFRAEFG